MDDLSTWIERVRAGDRGAYGHVVERFGDMAVGYATAQLGDRQLAEDAAQEAFLQAWLDLEQLRDSAAFPGWFRRIVHKHCDRIRRRQHAHFVPLDEEAAPAADLAVSLAIGAAIGLEADERRAWLEGALCRLPHAERVAVRLHYLGHYSQAEIAAFLEIPVTTVNNRMHSARKHLKQEILQMAEQERDRTPDRDTAFTGRIQQQIEAMTTLHQTLSTPLREALAETLGELEIRVAAVDSRPGLLALRELGRPCCTYGFEPVAGQQRICFDVGMELACCLVGRDVGRGDDARVGEVGAQMSADEWPRINPFAKRVMAEVVRLWGEVVEMAVLEPQVETNPLYVMDAWIGAQDPVFHVRFEVAWDGRSDRIDLFYPAPSLAAGLERLQAAA